MKQGDKIRTTSPIRSRRSGRVLPREGTYILAAENKGRRLVLVDFGDAGQEFLLPHEIREKEEKAS